jgi:hypothetical protein
MPLSCFSQMTVSEAEASPWMVVARLRMMRSYSGAVAVK